MSNGEAKLATFQIVNGRTVFQTSLGRRNKNFIRIFQRLTDAQSFYNSAQLSVIKRYSRGFRAQLSYTFAHSVDDASGINSQDFNNNVQYVSNWYQRTTDRGLSDFAVRHSLAFNWTWALPFAK